MMELKKYTLAYKWGQRSPIKTDATEGAKEMVCKVELECFIYGDEDNIFNKTVTLTTDGSDRGLEKAVNEYSRKKGIGVAFYCLADL